MKFKAVHLGHSRFVVNKSEKKNAKIALNISQPKSNDIFFISPCKHMLWVLIRSASMRHF